VSYKASGVEPVYRIKRKERTGERERQPLKMDAAEKRKKKEKKDQSESAQREIKISS